MRKLAMTVGVAAAAVVVMALAGCQGVEAPYGQRIVAQVAETTAENQATANIQVDGKDVFGPVDLAPGERRNVPIHEPQDAGPKLTPGVHRISWRLEKKGMPGKVGDIELKIFSGTNQVIYSTSTKYRLPNVPYWWFVDVKVAQPTTAGPAGQPRAPAAPAQPRLGQ
jgi:hypothetical protein